VATTDAGRLEAVYHRYGRLSIGPPDPAGPPVPPIPSDTDLDALPDVTDVERLGLQAFRLRQSPEFGAATQDHSIVEEPWGEQGCCIPEVPELERVKAESAPTSDYLMGSVAVGVVIVEGPSPDLKFSAEERVKIVAGVQQGLSYYPGRNTRAGISFSYSIETVPLWVPPDRKLPSDDWEDLWRDPAMAALGYHPSWTGVYDYVEALRKFHRTDWAYCVYFTKYPVWHDAYANIGGPRVVMNYKAGNWGINEIDRVFTHETGHIFGAPDEYSNKRYQCDCTGTWGIYSVPNKNCAACSNGKCFMKTSLGSSTMCKWTRGHLGWDPFIRGNPALVQNPWGSPGDFYLAVPSQLEGILYYTRDNSGPHPSWRTPARVTMVGQVEAVSMIAGAFGDIEFVAREGTKLKHFSCPPGMWNWSAPQTIPTTAAGVPALVQSRYGTKGNFELACPAPDKGIRHLYRDNDKANTPWILTQTFGTELGRVDDVTMIQARPGTPGDLQLVARAGSKLHFFCRDPRPGAGWVMDPRPLATDAAGAPSLIQSTFGKAGNFELCYPGKGGWIAHLYRENDNPQLPWIDTGWLGSGAGPWNSVALIQTNTGDLYLVGRAGDAVKAFRRTGTISWTIVPTLIV
jgi:hypothetical protein